MNLILSLQAWYCAFSIKENFKIILIKVITVFEQLFSIWFTFMWLRVFHVYRNSCLKYSTMFSRYKRLQQFCMILLFTTCYCVCIFRIIYSINYDFFPSNFHLQQHLIITPSHISHIAKIWRNYHCFTEQLKFQNT